MPFNKILCLLLLSLMGCNLSIQKRYIPSLKINPNQNEIECDLSDISKNMRIVHLETSETSLLSHFIRLIHIDENVIIILSNKQVFIFDNNGKYLSKIDFLGKGPGEYATISNVYVDNNNKIIYIFDNKSIHLYNFNSNYIRSFKFSFIPGGGIKTKNGNFLASISQMYSQKDRDMLFLLDSNFNIEHKYKSMNHESIKNTQQNLFFTFNPYELNNEICFREPFVDTIYQIKDTTLIPYWFISTENKGFSTIDGINTSNYSKACSNKIQPFGLLETSKYFFISFEYTLNKYYMVYDKECFKCIYFKKYSNNELYEKKIYYSGMKNNFISESPLIWFNFSKNDTIISLIEPSLLNSSQQKKLNCKEGDNPLLIIMEIK